MRIYTGYICIHDYGALAISHGIGLCHRYIGLSYIDYIHIPFSDLTKKSLICPLYCNIAQNG